jgi:REP element-mobilizing transposase RayT
VLQKLFCPEEIFNMTLPRSKTVDLNVTHWYHCISRCVRRAFLIAEGEFDRKAWLDNRLKELNSIFAVSVAGFSIMENHLHLLLRVDPDVAEAWTPMEVAQRWLKLFPPRVCRKPVAPTQEMLEDLASNPEWVQVHRERLMSLSWFMKCLKEPLSRLVNREEKCRGTFFESRFSSQGLLDNESILAVAAYIDLNPVAAGIAKLPEKSLFTSIKERVENIIAQGRLQDVSEIRNGSVAAQNVSEGIEEEHWLVPIEDRRSQGAKRAGIKDGFTLGQYLMLIDCISRKVRDGKANVSANELSIFERLSIDADTWLDRVKRLLTTHRFYGSFMSASQETLRGVAAKLGVRRLANAG